MANRTRAIRSRPALALALVLVAGVPRSARAESVASAESVPPAPSAALDVRAFAGFGSGIAADVWLPGRSLRVDLDAGTVAPSQFDWGGLAVIQAGLRTADQALEIKVLPTFAAGVRVRL